jgi:hypothetical protein
MSYKKNNKKIFSKKPTFEYTPENALKSRKQVILIQKKCARYLLVL